MGNPIANRRDLGALSSPKPGHGPFYLQPQGNGLGSMWPALGSEDQTTIAGWKRFLHPPTGYQIPQRGATADDQCKSVRSFPAGTTFSGEFRFDNLSDADLGLLLCSFDPRLLGVGWEHSAHRLGMGKPLGLGSVQVQIDGVELVDRVARYRSLTENSMQRARDDQRNGWIDSFKEAMTSEFGSDLNWWAELRAALSTETVAKGRKFGYPPGPPNEPEKSFAWFEDHKTTALPRASQVATGLGLPTT
jgi:CRISPR-associated protein (TIGR03986 family)